MPKSGHTIPVLSELLNQPTGRFAVPCLIADASASLQRAIEVIGEAEHSILPISRDGVYIGVFTQATVLKVVMEDEDLNSPVGTYATAHPSIAGGEPLSSAIRILEYETEVVVLDAVGKIRGILTPSNLQAQEMDVQRPAMVGGMATPFGVFLTSGSVVGGKSGLNLVATGLFLISLFLAGDLASSFLHQLILGDNPVKTPRNEAIQWALLTLPPFMMLFFFRFLPIAGYHAAEHQVVHAIERGEPLVPEVVSRMPRVHPRCGTNLAVAASMFMTISQTKWHSDDELRFLVALLVTLFFWRSVGSFVQLYVTTRKPTPRQIQSGIDAGKELLHRYAVSGTEQVSPFLRIWNSGLLHVMFGSFLAYGILELIGRLAR